MSLGRSAFAVLLALSALALLWFCLWSGGLISDTHTKTEAMFNILTSRSSARETQIDQAHDDNAANISANTNRLEALENKR